MYSNNLEGRQGSDLIQYSTPWEYEATNKQTSHSTIKKRAFLLTEHCIMCCQVGPVFEPRAIRSKGERSAH